MNSRSKARIIHAFRLLLSGWLLAPCPIGAAVLSVDSFDQGGFTISTEAGAESGVGEEVALPFGSGRLIRVNPRIATPGSVMTATLAPIAGTLSFHAAGSSMVAHAPLDLRQTYVEGGPYSILGFSGFLFEFSDVQGVGTLIVELGSGSAVYSPETHRVPITGPGLLFYSFDDLNFGFGGSVESFSAMHFVYEALSPEFSFTLDEIRLVPEPGAVPLVAFGFGLLLLHRRGARRSPPP
jgi:hypothetical protein